MDLALNNLQRLICHKTQQTKPNQSETTFSFGLPHMDTPVLANQQKLTINSSVRIYEERWPIGTDSRKDSAGTVLYKRFDDDDDDDDDV